MALFSRKPDSSLPSSAEPSSSTAHRWKYHVFLSFSGVDTRWGFTSHLCYWLRQSRIKTFMDDEPDLQVGSAISPALSKAIEESMFAIVVLSPDYAASARCLEELTKICELMEDDGFRILPVFYNVEYADVRYQKGRFEEAFTKHQKSGQYESDKVQKWRYSLTKITNISGWYTRNHMTDAEAIESIVESVCRIVQFVEIEKVQPMEIDKKGVGEMKQAMNELADDGELTDDGDEVSAVEVYGMGDAGKTTMVKSLGSSSSSAVEWKYDVFLSFGGGDTRKGFTSHLLDWLTKRGIRTFHLLDWLTKRGIRTFMDDQILERGDAISTLKNAIKDSRFAIVVLSPTYAASACCLDELVKICQFIEDGHRILPVFYNVDPVDVINQKRSFEEAFTWHEFSGRYRLEEVQQWREALRKVASLFGWRAHHYKTEIELLHSIVDFVCSKINMVGFELFEATRKAVDEVMEALKAKEVTVIGVYGVGGVGKTSMVEHVCAKVLKDGMFHHVITAVVSKSPDLRKIQGTLADMLGLVLDEETEIGRSRRLMQKIRRGSRLLIILDNMSERIDLCNIGIPNCHELQRCDSKVLLITRTQNILHAMECHSNIFVDVLSEENSWTLFMKSARMPFGPIKFYNVARMVARKCAGIPVALIAVAKALGVKDNWKEAARILNASRPVNPEYEKVVFNCIKLSYDYLVSDDARSCFLLCCLFPEDYDIQIEDLLKYGMGKGLFQDSSTIQDARTTAHSVVKYLRDCSLLSKSQRDGCVKMHDVIRDVAIKISSSEDGQLFFVRAGCQLKKWPDMSAHESYPGLAKQKEEDYSAISLIGNKICKLPEKLVCRKLLILFLQSNICLDEIPESFFQSLNELRVLDLSQTKISKLPTSLYLLINLLTLYLDGCLSIINNISILGRLEKLEILSMRELPLLELPKELGLLSNLRMLDITGEYVDIVPSEVISNLHRLEELYIQCNFADWRSKVGEAEVNGSKVDEAGETFIAAFDELTSLSHLHILKVFISNANCLPEKVKDEPNWVNFDICISRSSLIRKMSLVLNSSPIYTRALTLGTSINALPGWFINVVTTKAEKLQYLTCWGLENILVEYDRGRLHALKYLSVIGPSENLKVLMNTSTQVQNEPVFQNLEELHLNQVERLTELCFGELPPGSLCNLRLLKVKHCYEMVGALLPSQLLQRLQNLEKLFCEEMDELEYVFGSEGIKLEQIHLTKLKDMRLENLGKLIKIWNGPAPCTIFQNLQSLVVSRCFELENLFTADVAQYLLQLEDLSIECCPLLERVIEASKETMDSEIIFPKLKNLALIKLPQLAMFYGNSGSATECPLLEYLNVERCPRFSTSEFTAGTNSNLIWKLYREDSPQKKNLYFPNMGNMGSSRGNSSHRRHHHDLQSHLAHCPNPNPLWTLYPTPMTTPVMQALTPYTKHEKAVTLRTDVNLKKESMRVEPDEENPGSFLLAFTFDAAVAGSITIVFFAKEGDDCSLTATKFNLLPPVTVHFQQGLGQKFQQRPGTGINLSMFDETELMEVAGLDVCPLAVKAEASPPETDGSEGSSASVATNSEITRAVFERYKGEFRVRVVDQILWLSGLRYEVKDLYVPGKECVICLFEPRDTTVLPCRHMCMCSGCAKIFRYKTNRCPVCRQPVETLMEVSDAEK